jgi:hypothetical protein
MFILVVYGCLVHTSAFLTFYMHGKRVDKHSIDVYSF